MSPGIMMGGSIKICYEFATAPFGVVAPVEASICGV